MVEKPSFIVDGSPNTNWLADWGAWFENHYAFRQQLITANSLLYTELFNTSPVEKVLPGQDGCFIGKLLLITQEKTCCQNGSFST